MLTEEILENLKCAYSDEEHFLIEPVKLLSCEHAICKNCYFNAIFDDSVIYCKICEEGHFYEEADEDKMRKMIVSQTYEPKIINFIGEIFDILHKETTWKLNPLIGTFFLKNKIKIILIIIYFQMPYRK